MESPHRTYRNATNHYKSREHYNRKVTGKRNVTRRARIYAGNKPMQIYIRSINPVTSPLSTSQHLNYCLLFVLLIFLLQLFPKIKISTWLRICLYLIIVNNSEYIIFEKRTEDRSGMKKTPWCIIAVPLKTAAWRLEVINQRIPSGLN